MHPLTGTAKGSSDTQRSSNSLLDFLFLPLCNGYGVRSVALRNVQTLKRQRVRTSPLQEIPNKHCTAAQPIYERRRWRPNELSFDSRNDRFLWVGQQARVVKAVWPYLALFTKGRIVEDDLGVAPDLLDRANGLLQYITLTLDRGRGKRRVEAVKLRCSRTLIESLSGIRGVAAETGDGADD